MKLNCLIVDDEPIARNGLEEYVKEVGFLQLVGKCENAAAASSMLSEGNIDLLLLDIQMPKLSGIEFLKTLHHPPMVILTTAYSEYALEGYSLDIIDYLVKPIPFDRFLKAVQKAHDYFILKNKDSSPTPVPDYFFVKCDNVFEKVLFNEVLYIEAMQNYCIVYTQSRKLITYLTLGGLEEKLPSVHFLKVHKSFIINVNSIKSLDSSEILIANARIPISRTLKDEVLQRIMGNNLFKR